MYPALLSCFLALAPQAAPDDAATAEAEIYIGGISVGAVREHDLDDAPDLDGFRVGFTAVSLEAGKRYGHAGTFYLEWKESRVQEVWEGGVEVTYPYFEFSRVRVGPRLRLAVQERAEPPHRGTDVVAGVGIDLGVWLTERVQIAALADRSFGFEGRGRSSYSLNLRYLPWGE